MIWFQALIALAVFTSIASMVWHGVGFAPYVPSEEQDIAHGLDLATLEPGEQLVDIGCGDGRVVRAAARRGARALGLEAVWSLVLFCRLLQWCRPIPGVRYRHGNFFHSPLPEADIYYLYGLPGTVTVKLWPKLCAEGLGGARVVSLRFPIEGVEPFAVDRTAGHHPAYLYHIPHHGAQ